MACAVLVIRVKRQEFTREGAEARRREELAAAAKPLSLRRPGVWRNLADRERLRREHAGFASSGLRVFA
jgi:hypothetical protein